MRYAAGQQGKLFVDFNCNCSLYISQLRCFIFPGLFCPTLNIEILDDNFYAKYFCFLTLFQITKFLWNTDYDIRELYIVCRIKKSLTFIL